MGQTYTKIDDSTLAVETTEQVMRTYAYDFLVTQRAQIVASRDAELAEVDRLLAEAVALGIGPRSPEEDA